ncbi:MULTISPECIES: hypothetical protein [unclassified Novosphingobium]|uniref:hypothetical protein n=1 Tax=unclassified Novosphingobium TaxID=2644732 RepID=UPI000B04D243|nr:MULTISPECIES: hypothetical protein [unclassified Novosphingobium]
MSLLSRYEAYLYEQCRRGGTQIGTQLLPWFVLAIAVGALLPRVPTLKDSLSELLVVGLAASPILIGAVLVTRARWRAYCARIDEDGRNG